MSGSDDDLAAVFAAPPPLNPPAGAFERITRNVRRRRRARALRMMTASTTAAVLVAIASVEAVSLRDHRGQDSTTRRTTTVCDGGSLAVSVRDGSTAGSTKIGIVLVVTNRSDTTCRVSGYPSVGLVNTAGTVVERQATAGGTVLWRDPRADDVVLTPGASASAGLEWQADSNCSGQVPAIDHATVSAPGSVTPSSVTVPSGGCYLRGLAVTALVGGQDGPPSAA